MLERRGVRSRPATGFNTDLKTLLALQGERAAVVEGIFVPYESSARAWPEIRRLRALGERVVVGLPEQRDSGCCDRLLRAVDGQWQVETL